MEMKRSKKWEMIYAESIESKKTPKANLANYQSLILSFSLALTMGIVIMAFEWKSYDKAIAELMDKSVNTFEVLTEIPPTEIPPPPPPSITLSSFVEVPDEEEIMEDLDIKIDVEISEESRIEEITIPVLDNTIEKEDSDAIFTIVESPAAPEGGFETFYKDIAERMNYPAQARRMAVEGRVFVEFVINRDGSLTDLSVIKGIGAGCDEEAIRVLKTAPPWTPGRQRGKPVRQKMVLPIVFKLSK
jgi:protein TonB